MRNCQQSSACCQALIEPLGGFVGGIDVPILHCLIESSSSTGSFGVPGVSFCKYCGCSELCQAFALFRLTSEWG